MSTTPRPGAATRRGGPSNAVTALLVMSVLAGATYVYDRVWDQSSLSAGGAASPGGNLGGGSSGTGRTAPANYAFMATLQSHPDEPVRFDVCRPIHIVVNKADAPPLAEELLNQALAEVSKASNLQFVVDGETSEPPRDGRPARDLRRYGLGRSPVLVAWTNPGRIKALDGTIAGIGGPVYDTPYSGQQWASGIVYLDGPAFRDIVFRPNGFHSARAILMHELSHLVGLSHVDRPTELMYHDNVGLKQFGPGDREGLRRLGDGDCD